MLCIRSPRSVAKDSEVCLQALEHFGDEVGIAFSGAEDVALVEYAHLTGRPYRVFRCEGTCHRQSLLVILAFVRCFLPKAVPALRCGLYAFCRGTFSVVKSMAFLFQVAEN